MQVEEARLARIDAVAQIGVRLVRRSELDGLRFSERAIERRSGRGAGQDPNLELLPGIMAAVARAAIAIGIAFGAPAGVNPLNPTVCPCWINEVLFRFVGGGLKLEERQQFAACSERRGASQTYLFP